MTKSEIPISPSASSPSRVLHSQHNGVEGTLKLLRALIVVAVVLPLAILSVAAWYDWHRLKGQAMIRSEQTADLLREHALKAFQIYDLVLDRLDERLRGMSWEEIRHSDDLHRDMKKMIDGLQQISTVLLVDPQGRLSTNSRQHPANPLNNSDRGYFRVPRDGHKGTFIDDPVIGRVSGQPIVNISRGRSSPDGEFNGILAIAVFLDYFSQFYQQHNPDGQDSVALNRSDGVVLIRHPAAPSARLSNSGVFMRSISAGATAGVFQGTSPLDGVTRIFAFRKVGDYPVYVTYGLGLRSVRQEWLEGVAVHAVFALVTIFGLLGFILLAMRRARSEAATLIALQAEIAARSAAETAYEALYTQTPLPLHSVDGQGRLVGLSDRWTEFMGYAREEVIGRHVTEFMTEESRQKYQGVCWPRLLSEGFFRDVELQFVRKSGQHADILVSARATYDSRGEFLRTLTVLVDVTDRKIAEMALVQAQKMEAIGNLTGGVAHDFNNLLQGIYGCFRGVLRRSDDPSLRRIAETGQHAVERGARLIHQLTSFARRQPLRPEPRDPASLIRGMQELLRRSLPENIALEFDLPLELWPVMIDATELELALLNIAVNARDALPNGGTFRVEARNISMPSNGAELSGDFVQLKLSDNGLGMRPETLKRVFEPFFTTKEVGRGSGLGLAMVQGFATQSGGTVTIDSQEGKGTTITLLLPRSAQPALEQKPGPAAEAARGEGMVLVVDDDPAVGAATLSLCTELGYSALRAASAAEALSMLSTGPQIDIVITDVVMPGKSGLALAAEIEIRWPEIRVILATGYSEATLQESHRKWPLLKKPFTLSEVGAVLNSPRPAGDQAAGG